MTRYTVPNYNDSFCRVILDGELFFFRFTYNVEGDFWTFGLWKDMDSVLFSTKMVPNIKLNAFITKEGLPKGSFYVISEVDQQITKDSFSSGAAYLAYVPENENLEVV